MALFRRDPALPATGAATPAPDPAAGGQLTRIAHGTRIEGKISGHADLVVEGELTGEVAIDAVAAVGPTGRVEGPIAARVARIAGHVVGDVRGAERVEIAATAELQGDVSAPRVTIAEGAFFKGRVEMKAPVVAAAETAPTAASDRGRSVRPGKPPEGARNG